MEYSYTALKENTTLPEKTHRWSRVKIIAAAALASACTFGCSPIKSEALPSAPETTTRPYYIDRSQSFYENIAKTDASGDYPELHHQFNELLRWPVATWVGDNIGDSGNNAVHEQIEKLTKSAADKKEIPVIVAYNIPDRDLGEYSSGGSASAKKYIEWITSISTGIGDRDAVIALEPDALAGVPEMEQQEGDGRIALLRDTLLYFKHHNPNTTVYLDAGHDAWLTPEEAAKLLKKVDKGDGLVTHIALNISNFGKTKDAASYGDRISQQFGHKLKLLIDTGRNGATLGDREEWCNNPDARLGKSKDHLFDPSATVEEMMIKPVGESDGDCGTGKPDAGEWDARLLSTQLGHPKAPYKN